MNKVLKIITSKAFLRTVSIVFVVLWMCLIFMFSAESGSESTETSDGVIYFIARVTVTDFDALSESERAEIIDSMSGFIRTAGHFCEFAVLGLLSLNALLTFEMKMRFKALFAFLFSVFYAVTDEIHQYFVPDRVCDIKDVAVDSAGALCGVAFMLLLVVAVRAKRNRINNDDTQNKQRGYDCSA